MKSVNKYASESVLYSFNMTGLGRLSSTDTISGVTSVSCSPSGLTIGTPSHDSSKIVQVRISGGAAGSSYIVSTIFTTVGGDTLEARFEMRVE